MMVENRVYIYLLFHKQNVISKFHSMHFLMKSFMLLGFIRVGLQLE